MEELTKAQARRFLLKRNGLLGRHIYSGAAGALDFVRAAGCIQYDPIDVCGKSPELTLLSRVKGFDKETLPRLLYNDRVLFDYWDKCMCIAPMADWPYYARRRRGFYEWEHYDCAELSAAMEAVPGEIERRGALCSGDFPNEPKIRWPWGSSGAYRAALELLYYRGELVIENKRGTRKYYQLASRRLPEELLKADDPFEGDEAAYLRWHIRRRIGAPGLLWNRHSDAFLDVVGINAASRNAAFAALEQAGEIVPTSVEGIKEPLYYLAEDAPLMEEVLSGEKYAPRCEAIAPLDNMMWDRRLIAALFGFEYTWEIYTPASKRKYGYYVLPVIYGERFAGRMEAVADKKGGPLRVKALWMEAKVPKRALMGLMERLARFNGCSGVEYGPGALIK